MYKKLGLALVAVLLAAGLQGCLATSGMARVFIPAYVEPSDGPVAHLRLTNPGSYSELMLVHIGSIDGCENQRIMATAGRGETAEQVAVAAERDLSFTIRRSLGSEWRSIRIHIPEVVEGAVYDVRLWNPGDGQPLQLRVLELQIADRRDLGDGTQEVDVERRVPPGLATYAGFCQR